MKRLICIIVSITMLVMLIPISAEVNVDLINTGSLEIDDDGSDGYSGDYVVIYNPGTSTSGASTGNLTGLIETQVGGSSVNGEINSDPRGYTIDVDAIIAEANKALDIAPDAIGETLPFEVGDTHTFSLYSSYCPLPNSSVEFEVLAKGEHCYIWTPTSTADNVYPLDEIDESFAQICADEFDSKFDLMQSSFGNHTNGSQGDGRLNILYYNIDDGWTPGNGYVAGFFSSSDIYSNGMPILNIDTYPGVYYVTTGNEVIIDIEDTYGTMVHEYQHLINYSVGGYNIDTWLNECMSAAAEEICYPGSSVSYRIQSWQNYKFSVNQDWLNPPAEYEYQPSWSLHNGYSMYDWSNYLEMSDRLALYAQVSLYAQYIYSQYGNSTFRTLLESMAGGRSFTSAFEQATGQSASDFTKNFRIALTANDPNYEDGIYGFRLQEGYDPEEYYGVENIYNWLSPVVFTGSSCSVKGGGAITVKPVGGVYYPPTGASSSLRYYGITLDAEEPEPVALTGISLNPAIAEVYAGGSVRISAVREPENSNNYELTWESSNTSVATVSGSKKAATVTGVSAGTATISVTAHDLLNDLYYYASAVVTVKPMPTLNEALNIQNGTLEFTSTGAYPWNVVISGERAYAKSTNEEVSSSTSVVSLTVNMNAGDTMSFDWFVSSESNYDKLIFKVNGSEQEAISGQVDWTTVSYTAATTRSYTFTWTYSKDGSVNSNSDCGGLDNVYVPGYEGMPYQKGDVDMNGVVDSIDVVLIIRFTLGIVPLNETQQYLADMDDNGVVDNIDAVLALRCVLNP